MKALREKIEQEIRSRGPIPFSRYMEMCLYDEELGYYSRHAEQFGKAGDFYTSSDVHAVFGRLLARQFEEMWRVLGSPAEIGIFELGPGRGLFARDVLDWSEKKFPEFFGALRYSVTERSPALRSRMGQSLDRHFASGRANLASPPNRTTKETEPTGIGTSSTRANQDLQSTSASAPEVSSSDQNTRPTILFANEFFDALPVEIVSEQGSLRIDAHGGRFVETWAPASPEELEFLDRYSVHPENDERVEVPLAAQREAHRALAEISDGFAVIIDYGYTREEQLAGRHRGTVKAIRQHAVSASPYEAPGEQDITADVNFTALAAEAEKHSCHAHKLITQSQFLMGIGEANQFADAFEECHLAQERAKVALQLKHLVTPAGMGESFQVLTAGKGMDAENVSILSGLSFGRQ